MMKRPNPQPELTRGEALKRRTAIGSELARACPALDASVAAQEQAFRDAEVAARKMIDDARQKLADARQARAQVVGPLERERDRLESTLQGDLTPPTLKAALDEVSRMLDQARHARGDDAAENYQQLRAAETALRQLMFVDGDIEQQVESILENGGCVLPV